MMNAADGNRTRVFHRHGRSTVKLQQTDKEYSRVSMQPQEDISAIAIEYFQRVEPLAKKHDPYTKWGATLIQQGAKRVFDELVAQYSLTEEALHQALRSHHPE